MIFMGPAVHQRQLWSDRHRARRRASSAADRRTSSPTATPHDSPGVRPGQRAGRGPDAHRYELPSHSSDRAGCQHAAATPSAVTVRPGSRAPPAPHGSGRVPGRVRRALRGARPVLPKARHAGNDPLRSDLLTLAAPPPGQEAGAAVHGFVITVPAADLAALTAVTTTAANAHGYLDIGVAGRTWLLPRVLRPFTSPHFEIAFPSRNQALQLQRPLVPSG
jgi:hypothetical protein